MNSKKETANDLTKTLLYSEIGAITVSSFPLIAKGIKLNAKHDNLSQFM